MSGWDFILAQAAIEEQHFLNAISKSRQQQSKILRELIRSNAATAFGINHRFNELFTLADFREAVPIRGYEGFIPWIDRIANGEQNVLTSAPVIAFEETGGSFSGGKLVPYTQASLSAFRSAILPWLSDLARRRPGITKGKVYSAISPATRSRRRTPGGIPIGLPSDAAYLGNDLAAAFAGLLAVPFEFGQIRSVQEWLSASRAALQQSPDLSFVSVWSPTFWLELVAPFEKEEVAILWPQLDTISCWTDGASSLFSENLRVKFPLTHIDSKGLLSTESAVTVPLGGEEGCIPAIRSAFFEFIDQVGQEFLVDELKVGESYRMVITTPGGFYRYDTGDLVKCVAMRAGVPRLTFQGRAGIFSDLVGEKINDVFVGSVLKHIPCAVLLAACAHPQPHYEIWFDSIDSEKILTWTTEIDQSLCQNPQYAYARALMQLRHPIGISKPGFWQVTNFANRRLGDVKPIQLLPLQA